VSVFRGDEARAQSPGPRAQWGCGERPVGALDRRRRAATSVPGTLPAVERVTRRGLFALGKTLLFASCLSLLIFAQQKSWAIDPLPFRDAAEEARFQNLTRELRCVQCQNQNIADSEALLAHNMRNEVFAQMQAGKTDQEIKDYLVDHYGEFVLYRPPVERRTWLLWFGPIALLVVGSGVIVAIVRRRAAAVPADAVGEEDLP
jgi:cytochrome c-type biogenesis protein CcmH